MLICSIITSFTSGGAETLVCNMAAEFRTAGHEAVVAALCDAEAVGNPAETETRMMARVKESGAVPISVELGSRRGLLSGARAFRRLLTEVKPDIVHAHTARAVLMLRLAGVQAPVILTHHNSRLSFPPRLFRLFDMVVSAYVAISRECAEIAGRYARRSVELIVNGADARFRAPKPRHAPADNPVVVAVGTASEQKNYPVLIRAARLLEQRIAPRKPTIRIVGGGAILPELQALIDTEGARHLVELTGPRHDVPELLRESDLFANSSHYEGMSVAMLEALSAALPIAATRVPGNVELVEDGVNGVLAEPDSPEALAEAMARLLEDEPFYAGCSAASLKKSAPYTLEGCAAAHLALYEKVLGKGGLRSAA